MYKLAFDFVSALNMCIVCYVSIIESVMDKKEVPSEIEMYCGGYYN